MTDITSDRPGGPQRPEDATTLEEFQARRDAELERIRAARRTRAGKFKYGAAITLQLPSAALWYWVFTSSGEARFGILALALACNAAVWQIVSRVDGTRRRRALNRLSKQWQTRATVAEVPPATP
jgi:hypothetical protein